MVPAGHRLVGHYKETQANEPCRQLYPRSGLTWDGGRWVGRVSDLPPDPAWLAIKNQVVGPPAGVGSGSTG